MASSDLAFKFFSCKGVIFHKHFSVNLHTPNKNQSGVAYLGNKCGHGQFWRNSKLIDLEIM